MCSYEIWSFGLSNFGQNQCKSIHLGYCAPLFSLCVPMPRPRVVAGDATRWPSVILGFRVDAFLSFPEPYPFLPVLSFLALTSS